MEAHLASNTIWSAPGRRSGDGALAHPTLPIPKRRRASLAAALHIFRNGWSSCTETLTA
jgi:hypothetical protein